LVKTICLILFMAHLVGCNSMVLGYLVGATTSDTQLVRQLQMGQ